jgi:hypothetical protein
MIVQRPCETCGKPLRKRYAADRVPHVIFCDDACRAGSVRPLYTYEDHVGDLCSATPRTCERLGPDPIGTGHGATAYWSGCRCSICREANRAACAALREAKQARLAAGEALPPDHSPSAYQNHGCRCERCVEHHKAKCRANRERLRQRGDTPCAKRGGLR